jgi:stress response protein YsnF
VIHDDMLNTITGMDVIGRDGDRIGRAGSVFLDDETGRPEWITVETGLFGMRENFVPAEQATVEGDTLRIPYDKTTVKDAPQIEPTEGHIDQTEEDALYRYYGLTNTGTRRDLDDTGTRGTRTGQSDDAMTRSEERADVGVARYETGRARLRKYVETEHVTQTVPVRKERVRVETEPITDANRGSAMDGPEISEGEHEVTLHEERPVVDTETVPVERVRLAKEEDVDEVPVDVDLRKERIEVDGKTDGPKRDR